jgi:hypothetical protein
MTVTEYLFLHIYYKIVFHCYRIETEITVIYDNLFKCPDELGAVVLFHVLGHIQYIVCSFCTWKWPKYEVKHLIYDFFAWDRYRL